jgi:hypothetical protein
MTYLIVAIITTNCSIELSKSIILQTAWYSAENFQNHSKNILIEYHQKYSNKSESELRLIVSIASMTDHFYWLQQAKNLVKNTLNKMQAKMKKDNRKEFSKDSFVIKILIREELWISAY